VKRLLLAIFFLATAYFAARLFAGTGGVLALIATIPAPLWLGLGALTALFYVLDWIRFRSVLGVLGYRLRLRDGVQLTCVSYFVTSLTPSAELHAPAMVYMLRRQGVPAPHALAATLTKSIYMTLWICLVSWTTLSFATSVVLPDQLRLALPWLTLPLLGIALLLALLAFFPGPVQRWTGRIRVGGLWRKIVLGIGESAASLSTIGKSTDPLHLACHVASIAFLLTYVSIGWLLSAHFGFSLTWLQALTIFSTSLMVAYLAPVPGAIGVTELATSYMLSPALTPEGMAVALTLRILCWYLVALPGALVLAGGLFTLPKVFR
jgi:uncharacterized protein (TIRG00374 family)